MNTIILLFIWVVIVVILWISTVVLVVTNNPDDTEQIKARNAKYLVYIKTFTYILAVVISLTIGHLLK